MSIIPDPTNPEGAAITSDGGLANPVFVAPVGADPKDPASWRHVGWFDDATATTEESGS